MKNDRSKTGESRALMERLTGREAALLMAWYEARGVLTRGGSLYALPGWVFDALCAEPEAELDRARAWWERAHGTTTQD